MKGKKLPFVIAAVVVIAGLLLAACAAPAAPTTPTTPTTPTAPAQPKTLTISCNFATLWPLGLDALHVAELDADRINKNGGLDLGGEKYLIKLNLDDNKMDMALTKTLGEKAIFQDQVKFILGDPWAQPLYQLCDTNKVVSVNAGYDFEVFDPKWNWVVNSGCATSTHPATILYAAKHFPNKKTFVGCYPDRHDGRIAGQIAEHFANVAGLQVLEIIYYPPNATDMSAVGTKIKMLNPDMMCPYGGGPPLDAGIMKAAYAGGWRGTVVGSAQMPAATLVGIAGAEAVEGGLFLAWPAEFDPATTPEAIEMKADYITRFGKWDDPEPVLATAYFGLKGGLLKANSVDPAKVITALKSGGESISPLGTIVRFPRLDQGNPATVDGIIGNHPVKTIVGGKAQHIDTISVEQQLEFMKQAYTEPW